MLLFDLNSDSYYVFNLFYTQEVCLSVSVYTLAAIAVDRYLAICRPLKFHIRASRTLFIVAAIWVTSFTIMAPQPVFTRSEPSSHAGYIGKPIWLMKCYEVSVAFSKFSWQIMCPILNMVGVRLDPATQIQWLNWLSLDNSDMSFPSPANSTLLLRPPWNVKRTLVKGWSLALFQSLEAKCDVRCSVFVWEYG